MGDTIKLPPLPQSKTYAIDPRGLDKQVFSVTDMQAYATQAIEDDRKLRELTEEEIIALHERYGDRTISDIIAFARAIIVASRAKAASANGEGR